MIASDNCKVLIDMSPLDTPSRLRGIGQYIIGLASGIRELQAQGDLGIEIEGLACFDAKGRATGVDNLDYQGTMVHPDGFDTKTYIRRKLSGLHRAALSRGGHLIHVTEPGSIRLGQNVPCILTCYDLIPLVMHKQYLGKTPWARYLRRRQDMAYYRSARRIMAISEATRRDLVQYLDIDESIVDITYLGVDHERFQPCPTAEDEQDTLRTKYALTRPFLLYLGAYDPRKNIPVLIRAFAAAGLAKDFDLVLAGAIREGDLAKLKALSSKCNVSSVTRIIGFVDEADVAAFYRSCHLHVFPSVYEGFGLPVAEAMACGAPTITTNASSLPEVTGTAACIVPPNDVDALSMALRAIAYDDDQRNRLRAEGPKEAARFQWKECAKQTVESYRKALLMG